MNILYDISVTMFTALNWHNEWKYHYAEKVQMHFHEIKLCFDKKKMRFVPKCSDPDQVMAWYHLGIICPSDDPDL